MSPKVDALWSPSALQDLIDIWIYFSKLSSPEFADSLIGELRDAEHQIVANPYGWRERTELMPGIHGFLVRPYTVFYRIADNIPEIVRVLHERRDAINLLSSNRA
jgi:plasmid stabilization system protein ParE